MGVADQVLRVGPRDRMRAELAADDGTLTGVLDWANAAAGHPDLDRAGPGPC